MKNPFARLLILLLAPVLVLTALYGWVLLRSPGPESAPLVRTSSKSVIWPWDHSVAVRLHINLEQAATVPIATPGNRYVVSLVVDHSASMREGPDSPLEAAKAAASSFALSVGTADQPVGAVMFDDRVQEVHPISPDGASVAEAIDNIPPGGNTDIAGGVQAAIKQLDAALAGGRYPTSKGLLVLLSDGQSDPASALAAASDAKQKGLRVITVGLGTQINEELLRSMASSPADFHFTLSPESLLEIYSSIAADLGPVAGFNGLLTEHYHHGAFALDRAPAGYITDHDSASGLLETKIPVLFPRRTMLRYTLEADKVGLWSLALRPAKLVYTPDRNQPSKTMELVSDDRPPILVITWPLLILLSLPAFLYLLWRLSRKLSVPNLTPPPSPPVVRTAEPKPLRLPPALVQGAREPQAVLVVGLGAQGRDALERTAELLAADPYLRPRSEWPFFAAVADCGRSDAATASDPRLKVSRISLPSSLAPVVTQLRSKPKFPDHLTWLPEREVQEAAGGLLDLRQGSHGKRWLARLALFSSLENPSKGWDAAWREIKEWLEANAHLKPRILLCGGADSGSASGLATDLAHQLRLALPPSLRAHCPIYLLALVDGPEPESSDANQAALIEELSRLTLAGQIPTPRVYDPAPDTQHEYLRARMEEPPFDRVFLLQEGGAEAAPRQAALLMHTITERSLADGLEAHFAQARLGENELRDTLNEGTCGSLREAIVRYPAQEMATKLACGFVMEALGASRLIDIQLSPADKVIQLQPPPSDVMQRAAESMTLLPENVRAKAGLYQRFIQAAVAGNPRGGQVVVRDAARAGSLRAAMNEAREFARGWFALLLNGSPGLKDEREIAAARQGSISRLYGVLTVLCEFSRSALEMELPPSQHAPEDGTAGGWLRDVLTLHEHWRSQAAKWIAGLIAPEVVPNATSVGGWTGIYRNCCEEVLRVEAMLERERHDTWAFVLWADDILNPQLREQALYAKHIVPFMKEQHGCLAQWSWTAEGTAEAPEMRLCFGGIDVHVYEATLSGFRALERELRAIGGRLASPALEVLLVDALRNEKGSLGGPRLLGWLRDAAQPGLTVDRQFPGGDKVSTRVFLLLPVLDNEAARQLEQTLSRDLPEPLEVLHHGDRHSARIVVATTAVPFSRALVRRNKPGGNDVLPFVEMVERKSAKTREWIERYQVHIPAPEFSPLIRLLIAAPDGSARWMAVLAQGVLELGRDASFKTTFMLRGAQGSETVLRPNQKLSLVWALLHIAYSLMGVGIAEAAMGRHADLDAHGKVLAARSALERLEALAGQANFRGTESEMVGQVALLIELERGLQARISDGSPR